MRTSLFGPEQPHFTGLMCWRGLVDREALPPKIDPRDAGPPHGPDGHEPVALEADKSLLDPRERDPEEAGQLTRIALVEQSQRDEGPGPRASAEGRGEADLHKLSFDRYWRSNVNALAALSPPPPARGSGA